MIGKRNLGRWLAIAVLLVLLTVVGVQAANPHSYVSEALGRIGEAGPGSDATLTDITSVDQVQSAFNHDTGHPRLLLLFSPT